MALGFDMPGFTKTSALGPSRLGEIPPELDRRFSDSRPSDFGFGEQQFAPEVFFALNSGGDFLFGFDRATSATASEDYRHDRENYCAPPHCEMLLAPAEILHQADVFDELKAELLGLAKVLLPLQRIEES